jgi:hypothetical protein
LSRGPNKFRQESVLAFLCRWNYDLPVRGVVDAYHDGMMLSWREVKSGEPRRSEEQIIPETEKGELDEYESYNRSSRRAFGHH